MSMILAKDLAEASLDLLSTAGTEGLVIFKDGRPVARLTVISPDEPKRARS